MTPNFFLHGSNGGAAVKVLGSSSVFLTFGRSPIWESEQRHLRHVVLSKLIPRGHTNSPLTQNSSSNIREELFHPRKPTSVVKLTKHWTSYTHQNFSHADDANDSRHQPSPPRGICTHSCYNTRMIMHYSFNKVGPTRGRTTPASMNFTQEKYIVQHYSMIALKEICKWKTSPCKRLEGKPP